MGCRSGSLKNLHRSAPHDHRTADDQVVRPILVIEGYPSEPPALHRWAPPGGVPAI